jgi:hypothetical protein
MNSDGFQRSIIDRTWQELIDLGPRFLGTANEVSARNYILNNLANTSALINEHEFIYTGWSLLEPPELNITSPSPYSFPCEVFIGSMPTPPQGISGVIRYVGIQRVIGAFDWMKFAVEDPEGNVVAYISGRPDGPAHPQTIDPACTPLPHFIIGQYDLHLLQSWMERHLKVEVQAVLRCAIHPQARAKNVIASVNPDSPKVRIGLSAHFDSVYGCPGANDNAAAVTALLAIARRVTEEKWDIPLDFYFFTGEEWGLLGSKAYVADMVANQKTDKLKMLINLDSIAEGSSLEFWAGPESFEEQLRKVSQGFAHPAGRKIFSRFPPPVSSDHYPFYTVGVPACMLFCGETTKYHVPTDTYCLEGVDNILYITEFTWYLLKAFEDQNIASLVLESPTR